VTDRAPRCKNLFFCFNCDSVIYVRALSVLYIGVKYNEEKEQKAKWDAKQKELARIEEAKKREAEKGSFILSIVTLLNLHPLTYPRLQCCHWPLAALWQVIVSICHIKLD